MHVTAVQTVYENEMTVRKCDDCFMRKIQVLKSFSSFTQPVATPSRIMPRLPEIGNVVPPEEEAPTPTRGEVEEVLDEIETEDDEDSDDEAVEVTVAAKPAEKNCGCGRPSTHYGRCAFRRGTRVTQVAPTNGTFESVLPKPFAPREATPEERRDFDLGMAVGSRSSAPTRKAGNTSIESLLADLRAERAALDDKIALLEKTLELLNEHGA